MEGNDFDSLDLIWLDKIKFNMTNSLTIQGEHMAWQQAIKHETGYHRR